ncbi:MAG: pseudouridine synthase [Verrucomicrobiales bacterium]|nr:pseudouridine synthase [Verrucomicrobiales bacterium]
MSAEPNRGIRLNKFLASCDVGSRRGCEEFIRTGRVEINGDIVTDLSRRVLPDDHVKFDGKLLQKKTPLTLALNKPVKYLCTRDDPQGRKTIYDLIPKKFSGLHYIGRLDYQSSGLIMMTNCGELTEHLSHPRFHVEKEYVVHLDRPFDSVETQKLLDGIHLSEGLAKAESLNFETRRRLRMVLTQGYNRQIRRMFSKLGYKVKRLERVRIGSLVLPGLSTGDYQILNHAQIESARTSTLAS